MNSNKTTAEERALELFASQMIEKIKSVQNDWKKPWFSCGSTWATNLSGREYNGMNALMLMLHCEEKGYKVPVFATFDRITSLNFQKNNEGKSHRAIDDKGESLPYVKVNKGEEGFPVFITVFSYVHKETKERIKFDAYSQMTEEERGNYNVYHNLKTYRVFNVCSQTNIAEARPDLYQKIIGMREPQRPACGASLEIEPLDRMISGQWACPISLVAGNDAYYSISKDEIVVPLREQFSSGECFYGSLLHEMSHSTGAESRLNRLKTATFGSKEYAKEELVAELTAALISSRLGLEKYIKDDSAAYLKCWLDSLHENPDFIKTILFDVKRASSFIIQHLAGASSAVNAA